MKRSVLCLLILSAFSLISLRAQTGEVPAAYATAINTWITQDNARTKPADAPYAQVDGPVKIYAGDLDADGDDDYLALYGVTSGGNALMQYMAAFINEQGNLSTVYQQDVGAAGATMVDSVKIMRGTIECTTVIWRPDDGWCCPSGAGKARYGVREGKLEKL